MQLADNSIGGLVLADADSSVEYAKCQTRHAEVVGLYQRWRTEVIEYVEQLREQEQ